MSTDIDLNDGSKIRVYRTVFETTEYDLSEESVEWCRSKMDKEEVGHERKKGKWIDYPIADGFFQCTECGVLRESWCNFCPNCGADMRGEEDE